MPDQHQAVIGGIDCHTDFHVVAALDALGRVLGTESFPATGAGYCLTHTWLASFGSIAAVGVESTGSCGAALARLLVERGCGVIEINQPHLYLRSRRGKNDAIDAEAAARKVLSGEATAAATDTTGIVEAIPPAQRRPKQRCGGPRRRVVPARRLGRHGPWRVARATRRPSDPRGQGWRVRLTAPRHRPPRRSRPRRQDGAAQPRASHRPPRRRSRRARAPTRPARRRRGAHNPVTPRMRHPPHRDPARRRGQQHRPARLGGVLRSPVRSSAGPHLQRAHQRSPAQLPRQPRRQPSPAHDRPRPAPLLRTNRAFAKTWVGGVAERP